MRTWFTRLLLGFVLVSFGYTALRSVQASRQWKAPEVGQAASMPVPAAKPSREGPEKIVAYYFHVTVRCTTCRDIESYSREVIHDRFAREMAAGKLEWRLVNVQLPENRHFIQDYQLFTKSLVLVRMRDGQTQEYKVLNDTWELVGNKPLMQRYVERHVRGFLERIG